MPPSGLKHSSANLRGSKVLHHSRLSVQPKKYGRTPERPTDGGNRPKEQDCLRRKTNGSQEDEVTSHRSTLGVQGRRPIGQSFLKKESLSLLPESIQVKGCQEAQGLMGGQNKTMPVGGDSPRWAPAEVGFLGELQALPTFAARQFKG